RFGFLRLLPSSRASRWSRISRISGLVSSPEEPDVIYVSVSVSVSAIFLPLLLPSGLPWLLLCDLPPVCHLALAPTRPASRLACLLFSIWSDVSCMSEYP